MDLAKRVLKHRFLANIFRGKDLIRIVDVCSGTGIGGCVDYNPLKGTCKRIVIDLGDPKETRTWNYTIGA